MDYTTQTDGFTTEKLTKNEVHRIKKMVLGYGKFKSTAAKAGIPVTTLRDIINRGSGTPDNIQQIRATLLQSN